MDICKAIPAPAVAGFWPFADVLRTGIDTASFEPGVSADHERSVDIGGWLACAAIAERPPDTSGYSIEPGGALIETASRTL